MQQIPTVRQRRSMSDTRSVRRRDSELWTCPKCGRRFVGRNMWHACGDYSVEKCLEGRGDRARELFDRFENLIARAGRTRSLQQRRASPSWPGPVRGGQHRQRPGHDHRLRPPKTDAAPADPQGRGQRPGLARALDEDHFAGAARRRAARLAPGVLSPDGDAGTAEMNPAAYADGRPPRCSPRPGLWIGDRSSSEHARRGLSVNGFLGAVPPQLRWLQRAEPSRRS